jgi:hypothetical protein
MNVTRHNHMYMHMSVKYPQNAYLSINIETVYIHFRVAQRSAIENVELQLF